MNPIGILVDLLPEIGSFDWPFEGWRRNGPTGETVAGLDRLWGRRQFREIRKSLNLPHHDWQSFEASLHTLSNGEIKTGSQEPWLGVLEAAQEIEAKDPIVASVAALYAMAAWEGGIGERMLDNRGGEIEVGWLVFPTAAARCLLAADAVWGARVAIRRVLSFLEYAQRNPYAPGFISEFQRHRDVGERIEARIDERISELAWDLRAACTGEQNLRAEVAAVFWTLGDVPHAELLGSRGDPGYRPDMDLMREVVRTSIWRMSRDSLLQYIWLEMKDRPPLDLRGHRSLFARINSVYRTTPMYTLDSMGMPVSRSFARAAIGNFRGDVSDEAKDGLANALAIESMAGDARARLRLRALATLVLYDEPGDVAERWRELAADSTEILAASVHDADFEQLDGCLDLPFCYLESESEPHGGEPFGDIERYRSAGAAYWLTVVPPRAKADGARFVRLLEREAGLLYQVRSARMLRMLRILPPYYQRYGFDLRDVERALPPGAERREIRGTPFAYDPLDQDLALVELRTAEEALSALWDEIADEDPEYAAKRRDPCADLDAFISALMIDGLSARPPVAPRSMTRSS